MATYKGIQGYSVQKLSSNPTASEAAGQLWYNSGSGKFKISVASAGAWASGGALNVGKAVASGAGASQNAALCIGGSPDGSAISDTVESYDGTTWTEVGDMAQIRRYFVATGTQTAALACGGSPANSNVEQWDGSSWTEIADLVRTPSTSPGAQIGMVGFGSSTSAIVSGGDESSRQLDLTEQFDGTSWSEVADLNTARTYGFGAGTSGTSGLNTGGWGPGALLLHEKWDGTSWSEVNPMLTARIYGGSSNQGTVTASLIFGGRVPPATNQALTEKWDGTSWTEVGDLASPVMQLAGAGVSTSALAMGGDNYPGASLTATEEWSDPVYSIKTVTVS